MSTYSNEPQQNKWEIWFITSVILFIYIIIWGTSNVELQIIYDGLLLATFANLIYYIIVGLKK